MEALLALFVGVLMAGAGVYLLLRARTFDVVLGLTLLSYAVNVFIFVMGRIAYRQIADRRSAYARRWRTTPTRCRRRWC